MRIGGLTRPGVRPSSSAGWCRRADQQWSRHVKSEQGRYMPGRWTNAAYTCLMVALYVAEPSHVQLTVQDRVRIDRVTASGVEQHGELMQPGTTSVHLAEGTYYFRT